MSHLHQNDDISFKYFLKDFDKYTWSSFRDDLTAGLSVALLTVPQALAFSLVAGLPISAGLFAAIISSLIVAIFGSSRHLIVGPTNAIAILIQGGISTILFTYYREANEAGREFFGLQILTQLTLLVGVIQILAAFFKLGRLTHFVSHSVVTGYVSGVALALVINQLFPFLGMSVPQDVSSLFEKGYYIVGHLKEIHWPTAIVGLFCLSILLFLKKIHRRIPGGAIMLVSIALMAYGFDFFLNYFQPNIKILDFSILESHFQNIAHIGDTEVDRWIPSLGLPYFHTGIMNALLPVAFAIALLSVMEATSTAKTLAANSGQHLSINQEIFGLGLGNLVSSFIVAMPVSGSTSRSALSYENGARTRLASIFNSIFVVIILCAFGFLFRRIPVTAFSALLIISAASIIKLKQLVVCLKATRSDSFVLILTFLSCIFFSLDMAFYIGVIMSITLYLKKAAIPQLVEFTIDGEGHLHSIDQTHLNAPRKIRLIKVEGELFFGAADLFQTALKSIAEDDTTTKVIILQLKNARDIDATSCLALQQLYEYLRNSGRYLIGCGIPYQIWDVLSDSGMIELIGKENLFIFDEKHPYLSVQKAFSRAHEIIKLDKEKEVLLQPISSEDEKREPVLAKG